MNCIYSNDLPCGKYFVRINAGKLHKIEHDGSLTDFSNMLSLVYHELKLKGIGIGRDGDIFYNATLRRKN